LKSLLTISYQSITFMGAVSAPRNESEFRIRVMGFGPVRGVAANSTLPRLRARVPRQTIGQILERQQGLMLSFGQVHRADLMYQADDLSFTINGSPVHSKKSDQGFLAAIKS
jgi:hypothetical protein